MLEFLGRCSLLAILTWRTGERVEDEAASELPLRCAEGD